MELISQKTFKPTRKIAGASIGGAVSVILVGIINSYVLPDPMPAEINAAFTALITAGAGYLTREYR